MRIVLINIIAVILFIICRDSFAQVSCTSPAPPSFSLVSVQPETGFTDFQWSLSPSTNIAAYLIYIYHNENGIPRGDIIDTIWDPSATRYSYKSTISAYYSVSFVISAFRTPNCTSSFSNIINTIYTSAVLDTCNKKIKISWNAYPSLPKRVVNYTLLAGLNGSNISPIADLAADQTSYTLSEFQSNAQYCFSVKAVLEDGSFSTSNKFCLSTKMQQPPSWINADFATVDENNKINVSFTVDPDSKINTYRLERKTENENTFTQINQLVTSGKHLSFTDQSGDPLKRNFYRLLAVNNCGNPVVTSNIANNIVLALSSNINTISLNWNAYRNWRGSSSGYKIFINAGSSFSLLAVKQPEDTTLTIDYSSIMYTVSTDKICFYIGSSERNNPYGVQGETSSEIVCTNIEERITVPNTFTPNNDLKNDLFKPVLSFTPIEYHIIISNRQNKVIFESRDYTEEWNGKVKGEPQAEDVYLWFLQVRSPSGRNFTRKGTVTIIR
jgi:gliding motility-associated-like protein